MTVQTKHFIDAADLVSLRLQCKRCEVTMLLPLSAEIEGKLLRTCPQCNKPWAQLSNGVTMEKKIMAFGAALMELRSAMQEREKTAPEDTFSLTLEIEQIAP
jgi:NAD-dependent SIR2 family protein deacetylase